MNNLSLVTRKRKRRKPVGPVSSHYLSNVSDRLAMCQEILLREYKQLIIIVAEVLRVLNH